MIKTVIQELSATIQARLNCIKHISEGVNTQEGIMNKWQTKHEDTIQYIIDEFIPHGSGIDGTNTIDLDKSNGEKVIINIEYHHMDSNGFYCGWTDYKLIITPAFDGINIKIYGTNQITYQIKEYLSELFHHALTRILEIRYDKESGKTLYNIYTE